MRKPSIISKMRGHASTIFGTLMVAIVLAVLPVFHAAEDPRPVPKLQAPTQQDVADCASFLPYSADPHHIWNRVHRQLLERRDAEGKVWGCDEVDPLLWQQSEHILSGVAYSETVRLLDEFTSTHAEQLIHDPLRRAMFQRDLWAVFDWLASQKDDHRQERAELERRLAVIIKAVALTPAEIKSLPDNYTQIRGSTTDDGFALPEMAGNWLLVGRDDGTPVAPVHSFSFPRSVFLVHLKLPADGPKTSQYLESIRAYSRQHPQKNDCQPHTCNPPQFPVGTELALVRRALLIDTAGQAVASPITESVQLRRYREIPRQFTIDYKGEMQQMAELELTRRALLQERIDLRGVGEDEAQFPVFLTHGIDLFEGGIVEQPAPVLRSCHSCHQGIGAISFTSFSRVQFERKLFILMHASTEEQEAAAAITFLQGRDSWKLLQQQVRTPLP